MATGLGAVAALASAAAIDAVATRVARTAGLRWHGARRWLTVTAGVHGAMLLAAWAEAARLRAALAAFDIDGDGWFAGAEITPESEAALAAVAAETGRGLAPVTGLAVAAAPAMLLATAHAMLRRCGRSGR